MGLAVQEDGCVISEESEVSNNAFPEGGMRQYFLELLFFRGTVIIVLLSLTSTALSPSNFPNNTFSQLKMTWKVRAGFLVYADQTLRSIWQQSPWHLLGRRHVGEAPGQGPPSRGRAVLTPLATFPTLGPLNRVGLFTDTVGISLCVLQ